MPNCWRPDQVYRHGSPMPAGCYAEVQKVVSSIARDFTRDPAQVNQQYGPAAATVPQVVQQSPPSSGSPGGGKAPGFFARFFGAK